MKHDICVKKIRFTVQIVDLDLQFAPIQTQVNALRIDMNLISEYEHSPTIENDILVTKKPVRCVQTTLLLFKLPAWLTIKFVYTTVLCINTFPKNTGVTQNITPRIIITGRDIKYKHCQLQFGAYVQTHERHRNDTQIHCTIRSLALKTTTTNHMNYLPIPTPTISTAMIIKELQMLLNMMLTSEEWATRKSNMMSNNRKKVLKFKRENTTPEKTHAESWFWPKNTIRTTKHKHAYQLLSRKTKTYSHIKAVVYANVLDKYQGIHSHNICT